MAKYLDATGVATLWSKMKSYVDNKTGSNVSLSSNNTWTGTNTFNGDLKGKSFKPTSTTSYSTTDSEFMCYDSVPVINTRSNKVGFGKLGSNGATFDFSNLSSAYSYQLPAKSGTIALMSRSISFATISNTASYDVTFTELLKKPNEYGQTLSENYTITCDCPEDGCKLTIDGTAYTSLFRILYTHNGSGDARILINTMDGSVKKLYGGGISLDKIVLHNDWHPIQVTIAWQ